MLVPWGSWEYDVCVCVCVWIRTSPRALQTPSQWLAFVLWSMAGEILPATPRLGQPCPFKIEHWLACCGSWRAGSSLELTRGETRSDSLGEGVSPPDQTALREGKHKDANDSLLGILPGNQRIWLKWSTHFSLLIYWSSYDTLTSAESFTLNGFQLITTHVIDM